MVDYAARKELAELLRHFIAGRLPTSEFDERGGNLSESEDTALWVIYHQVWYLYDDFVEHRMVGDWRVSKEKRREIARWILFLQNGLEYQWRYLKPYHARPYDWRHLLWVLTFKRFPALRGPAYKDFGDAEVWPFYQRQDFENALRSPKLLAGA